MGASVDIFRTLHYVGVDLHRLFFWYLQSAIDTRSIPTFTQDLTKLERPPIVNRWYFASAFLWRIKSSRIFMMSMQEFWWNFWLNIVIVFTTFLPFFNYRWNEDLIVRLKFVLSNIGARHLKDGIYNFFSFLFIPLNDKATLKGYAKFLERFTFLIDLNFEVHEFTFIATGESYSNWIGYEGRTPQWIRL